MTVIAPLQTQIRFNKTNLYFINDFNQLIPLPNWAIFFINLGDWVAQAEILKNRLVVGLAIPTRNYAAALAALGVVKARVIVPTERIDSNRYFEQLCKLPKGTSVVFYDCNRRYKGIYQGIDETDGERRLRIQRENKSSGGLTNLVSVKQSHNVAIAQKPNISLPKKQSGRYIITPNDFLDGVIGKAHTSEFTTKTRLDCAVIGRINTLKSEILEIPFASFSLPSKSKIGSLQDILRVRKFLSEGQAYRSEILSSSGSDTPKTKDGLVPHVTIFDGATGFIKWRDDWRNSHWIILLERTEPHFKEAVDIIDTDYINRQNWEEIPNIIPAPSGVEMVVYQEPCQ
ncbi:hypothetical protein IQ244_23720 [Nostoc sp. LEGE 06077]|uniref:hypothetical protein n=1 Tax=Nostoc sp. LEGE 06077 TaxID=915325 RepID=UPI0018829B7B|nr:hypothetical protein [Nostoc sp. LEGE 06077]MBE9209450.1 hypothetical protein [Nostoc sp. LEGE 06077]